MFNKKLTYGYICFLAFFVIVFNSCEYQTDEVFYNDIDKDIPIPNLQVDLNLKTDTIYIYNESKIKLSLSLTNNDIYSVHFYINGIEVDNVYYSGGSTIDYYFYMDISNYSIAKIKVEIYTSTGTNSIADIVGSEYFLYESNEWTLIKCNDNLEITSSIEDGRLKLSWTPIKTGLNEQYFIKSSGFKDSTFNNWIIDNNYVGGTNSFIVSYDDNDISGYRIYDEISYDFPNSLINNKDSFCIHWDKSDFYNNIKGYRVVIDRDTFICDANATSFTYKNGLFGTISHAQVNIISNNESNTYRNTIFSGFAKYPMSFLEAVINYSYFPKMGSIMYYWKYVNNIRYLFMFNISNKEVVKSFEIDYTNFAVSPSNEYLLIDNWSYVTLLNNSLETVKSVLKTDISPGGGYINICISDNANIAIYDYSKNSIIVYDILSETLKAEIPVSSYVSKPIISMNGNYVYNYRSSTLYKIEDGGYTIVKKDENQFDYYEFIPESPDQIALYDGSTFYIKQCEDYSTVISFPMEGITINNIDYQNKKILTYKGNDFFIYSLDDGSILDTVPSNYAKDAYIFKDYIIKSQCQYNLK